MTVNQFGWLAYFVLFLASYAGLPLIALASFGVGIACHWRFWRAALPVGLVCFFIGFWWGSSD